MSVNASFVVQGMQVPALYAHRVLGRMPGTFRAAQVETLIGKELGSLIDDHVKTTSPAGGRASQIDRIADRFLQHWKKAGLITFQRLPRGNCWVKNTKI